MVCGDSFCSASKNTNPATIGSRGHFSQLLEDAYGYKIINLAHGGFSNVGIIYQLKQAVQLSPNIIVYNKSWSDRIAFVRPGDWEQENTLKNFYYYDNNYTSTGSDYVGGNTAPIISTVWQNIENSPFIEYTDEQLMARDLYLKYMYSDPMQIEIDTWLFEYWHQKIIDAGILPIYFNDTVGARAYEWSFVNQTYDSPFHTNRATQELIAADIDQLVRSKLTNLLTLHGQ